MWCVPMPLSGQRLAERGFNQALLLARALAPAKTDAALAAAGAAYGSPGGP